MKKIMILWLVILAGQAYGAVSINQFFYKPADTTVSLRTPTNLFYLPYALSIGKETTMANIQLVNYDADGDAGIRVQSGTSGAASIGFHSLKSKYSIGVPATDSNKFIIYTSIGSTNRFIIDSVGNVGIGSVMPLGKFTVSTQSTNSPRFVVRDSSTYNLLINRYRWTGSASNYYAIQELQTTTGLYFDVAASGAAIGSHDFGATQELALLYNGSTVISLPRKGADVADSTLITIKTAKDTAAAVRVDIRDTVNVMGITDSTAAGTGLTETGNTINANGANGITVEADTIKADTTLLATKNFVRDSSVVVNTASDLEIVGNMTVHGGVFQTGVGYEYDTSVGYYSKPPDSFLQILTYYDYPASGDSTEQTHPSFITFPGGYGVSNGDSIDPTTWVADTGYYKWIYWMVTTPLRTDSAENPTLYVSNDPSSRTGWIRPYFVDQFDNVVQVQAPIIKRSGSGTGVDHLSDGTIGKLRNGDLCILYRVTNTSNYDKLMTITSTNGMVWDTVGDTTSVVEYTSTSAPKYMSPTWTIGYGDNNYWVWWVDERNGATVSDSTAVKFLKVSRLDSTWNLADTVVCSFTGNSFGWDSLKIWHISVKQWGSQLHMWAALAHDSNTTQNGGDLWHATSTDGRSWKFDAKPFISNQGAAANRDSLMIYRTDCEWTNDGRGGCWQCLYGGLNSLGAHHIFYRKVYNGSYLSVPAEVAGLDHTPEDSVMLLLPTQAKAGDTTRLFVDTSYDAGGDDCYDTFSVFFDMPQAMYVDTFLACLATTGSLDSIEFWGKDFSAGLNLNDSLYQTYTTAFTTTTPTVLQVPLTNIIKTNKWFSPGDRITAIFYTKHVDANDKLACYWAKLTGYPK